MTHQAVMCFEISRCRIYTTMTDPRSRNVLWNQSNRAVYLGKRSLLQNRRQLLQSSGRRSGWIGKFKVRVPPEMTEHATTPSSLFQSAIQRLIPHRYPFLLVDRVTEFLPGARITGIKNFSAGDYAAQGQLDGAASAPVGILMEIVTQLGAILVLARPEMAGKVAVILQIPQARMLRPVVAGDRLEVEAEVVKMRESFGELRGAIHCAGELVAEGQMRFAITNAADLRSP